MADSIIIIGAGMGGLAAGIYGRLNGFRTLSEMSLSTRRWNRAQHSRPANSDRGGE